MKSTISEETIPVIPLSEPLVSGNEWQYVKECLDSGWVSSTGRYVTEFENVVAEYVGAGHAVAMVNGTSALHIAMLAAGIGPDDEVIVPTLTFIAPVNAVSYCGAHPVFMDCDPDTLCIDVDKVIHFLQHECEQRRDGFLYNKVSDRRVKAVVPVHTFGHPVDMEPLLEVCSIKNVTVIEDAAESLGSVYKDAKTGSMGAAGCFSFNGNKLVTTGGGGMLVTGDEELAARARHLSTQAKTDSLYYDHDLVGYNYRLTNVQAAIGMAQMERIEEFVAIKRKNARLYKELLSGLGEVRFIWEKPLTRSNFWFYSICVPPERKENLMGALLSSGIQVRPAWRLIHTLPMYKQNQAYLMENAPALQASLINLPCSLSIREQDVVLVCATIKDYLLSSM